jgi:hypothetical protein
MKAGRSICRRIGFPSYINTLLYLFNINYLQYLIIKITKIAKIYFIEKYVK